ncbi:MAG: 8-amino-7-oxononanoate synthase [Methylomonas sp.]|jgi:8-amino-7-oxononanoate synthase
MENKFYDFGGELEQIKRQNLYRKRLVNDAAQGTLLHVDGGRLLNFCSNDYLGLANHPAIRAAFKQAADKYGVGGGAAHLVCGHTSAHHALEEELADFTGRDRALLFSTGYMANLGVISALLSRGDYLFADRLNHASLLDGALLAHARLQRYPHADVTTLKSRLADCKARAMLVSDGVFSMDGDLAPLPALAELAAEYQTGLLIDDAHGFGVLGAHGGGIVEHFGLSMREAPILLGTLGKAFGTFGAFVAGSNDLIEMLIQKARTYIYTTAAPAAIAEASRVSLQLIRAESWRREKLLHLISRFRQGAQQLGLPILASGTPIQPLLIGGSRRAIAVSSQMQTEGFLITAIRPPTVPDGTARLRITFSANHEDHQIDALLEALAKALF